MTLESLFNLPQYKRGSITFNKNEELIKPFVDNLQSYVKHWEIKAEFPKDSAVDDEENEVIAASRFIVEGLLNDNYQVSFGNDKHDKVIGLMYALDVQKPVVKVWQGYLRQACTNTQVFNPKHLNIGYLNDENYDTVFNSIPTWLSNLEEDKIKFQEKYRMFTKDVLGNEIYEFIGKLGIQCQKRGLKSQFANMLSLLDNTQSMYYVPNGVKQGLYTRWDLIQQLTDNLKRMDFVNRASNSSQIFSLVESL